MKPANPIRQSAANYSEQELFELAPYALGWQVVQRDASAERGRLLL